jgi:hypothetical protein
MSRTGTSATMRLLNLLGVDIGVPEQLIGPSARQNAKGFYENRPIMLLNEELLSRLGGSWSHPPGLAPGWVQNSELDDLRDRARGVLEENFAGSPLWGFKDPRMCLTLPFWRDLIGDARLVICHRNVLEVAGSLESRDNFDLPAAVAQWTRYCASAVVNTARLPRMFVGYDELFTARRDVVGDLAALVGDRDRAGDPQLIAAVDDWLDVGLRHHVRTLAEVIGEREVPPGVRALQLVLDLAVCARAREPALRGLALSGPISDALDATARSLVRSEIVDWPRREQSSRARRPPGIPPVGGDLIGEADFVVVGSPDDVRGLADRLRGHPSVAVDGDAEPGQLRAIIDPRFTTGDRRASVSEIAARLVSASPGVSVILLWRDPIQRAIDAHRQMTRDGLERRDLRRALREQLAPGALLAARRLPSPTNGYIVWGEYGRVLRAYAELIAPSRILPMPADEPSLVPRLLSLAGCGAAVSEAIRMPADVQGPPRGSLPAELEAALDSHYATDAESIQALTGFRVPWSDSQRVPSAPAPRVGSRLEPDVANAAPRARSRPEPDVATAAALEHELAEALGSGVGFALIRLGPREIRSLTADHRIETDGLRREARAAGDRLLRAAIRGADAVVVAEPGPDPVAPEVRPMLSRLGLSRRTVVAPDVLGRLLGCDPAAEHVTARSPLTRLLADRPIAVVGPSAHALHRSAPEAGFDVGLAIDGGQPADELFVILAAARDAYDAVLVDADRIAAGLCVRLKTELEVVALDLGRAVRRLLDPGSVIRPESDAGRMIELYLQQSAEAPPGTPHPFEGRLVRERGTAAVCYIEHGRARWVTHRSILALIGGPVLDLDPGELASIPGGVRVGLVHDGRSGIYLLIDGRKVPLDMGMPVSAVAANLLDEMALDERRLAWSPGAPG